MAATITITVRLVTGDGGGVQSGDDSAQRSVDISIGTSSSLEQLAPQSSRNGESLWEVQVAVGAVREVVTSNVANWSVCGRQF